MKIQENPKLIKKYSKGHYNKHDLKEQWIRLSEGCPNNCPYCRETFENGKDPIYYDIPEIIRNKVKILDMNLIYKPKALEIIKKLGSLKVNKKIIHYELICGIDYRYLTLEIATALKENRFKNIRIAWDWEFGRQIEIKKSINILKKVGFRSCEISVFILANWKIPYKENCLKLDLCKVWNVKVNDCWFDNQVSPNIKPIHWDIEEIKNYRQKCRKHNQMVRFGIDPEYKKNIVNDALQTKLI